MHRTKREASRKRSARLRNRRLVFESLEHRVVLSAVRMLDGFAENMLPASDNGSAGPVDLGFQVDFFGDTYSQLFVSNNGNVTFGSALTEWSPVDMSEISAEILAPFWADVDTRDPASNVVTYGTDRVDERDAFGVNWVGVGAFNQRADATNSFQLVLIDRSDIAAGAFDVEFNYDSVLWDTFDRLLADDGVARAGFSAGTGVATTYYELIGSGFADAFLDDNATLGLSVNSLNSTEPGRYVFQFRSGTSLDEHGLAGQLVEASPGVYTLGSGIDPDATPIAQPTNLNAARTINVDPLREGGLSGLDLTGAGLTVGVWEADACYPSRCAYVRGSHQELAGRVAAGDVAGALSDHATHVAGTIGAAGVGVDGVPGTGDDDAPRGMATDVQLLNYDTSGYLGELQTAIAGQGIVASNHSWAYRTGWDLGTFAALGGSGTANTWSSDRDPLVFGGEDPDFGQYNDDSQQLDDVLFDNPNHLAVFAAGNDGPRPSGAGGPGGHFTNRPVTIGGTVFNDVYVTYFSTPPVPGFPVQAPAWWLVPTTAFTAPTDDGNEDSGFDSLPAGGPTAKNTLTVGAIRDLTAEPPPPVGPEDLADFSSWGPTDDGRVKPDVVANGTELFSPIATADDAYGQAGFSGTSMSSASATGAASLLVEHYRNLHGGTLPPSSTIKGAIIHTARDGGNPGPDYAFGWGVIDTTAAAEFLSDASAPGGRTVRELVFDSLPLTAERTVVVQAGPSQPLRATLVWTDPAGTSRTGAGNLDDDTPALVNDLDLTVIGPDGTHFPWTLDPGNPAADAQRSQRNDVDNVEQVLIDVPTQGTYTVRVSHSGSLQNGDPQPYSLLISAIAPVDEDRFEPNDTLRDATVLGSEPAVTLRDLTIHDVSDVDLFRTTASVTGKMVVNALFEHAAGDLDLLVRDAQGNILDASTSDDDHEQLVIPVVSQEVYFVEVYALGLETNAYSLEIEHFAAPLVDMVDLPARDQDRVLNDTGISSRDDITRRLEAEVLIEADLSDFAAGGIAILTPDQAVAMDTAGAAVEVFVNGNPVGYAEPVADTDNTLFRYTFTTGQLPAPVFPAESEGWLQYVKAAVRMIDGQRDPSGLPASATARTPLSQPLLLRTDTESPPPPSAQLLASSDSGISGDGITSVNPPAFGGVAEIGAVVYVYADAGDGPILVGQGSVGTDETDGVPGDDRGDWEVTIEPLADDAYTITVVVQDAAGNLSEASDSVTVVIDTISGSGVPQRPTIDLVAGSDSGMSDRDNVTAGDPTQGNGIVDVRVTSDANTMVDIKDGNFVIATVPVGASGQEVVTLNFNLLAGVTGFPAEGPHPLSAEATDAAGNRSVQSEELQVSIDFTAPAASIPDLLASSDTGTSANDNVTRLSQPAFAGSAEANAKLRVFADGTLVGQGIVHSDESDGDPTDGEGIWEITVEPLNDGVYDITTVVEDLAGNLTASDPLQIEVDTIQPNTPQLTLLDDTGHTAGDQITSDNTPTVAMTTHDPNVPWHQLLFSDYLTYRIYDRFEVGGSSQAEFLLYDAAQDSAVDDVSTPADGLTSLTQILETLPAQYESLVGDNPPALITDGGGQVVLADGRHHLKLEVEDRAGNISDDFLLTIHVDTAIPAGSIDLLASSDTGAFDDDNVTSLTQPAFNGLAEANAIVRLFADDVVTGQRQLVGQAEVGSDLSDVELAGQMLAGETVDGLPNDGLGLWEITAEPLDDGVYDIFAEFEDWAGNVRTTGNLRIEIDTLAPNMPLLDLVESSDSGRHNDDNITNDNTPDVTLTTHDPNVAAHELLFTDYLRFRIWDRFEGAAGEAEFLLYDSALDSTVENTSVANDTFTSQTFVETTLPLLFGGTNGAVLAPGILADGIHNLKLEVEDRAGNISADFLLELLIDTEAFLGDVHLDPDSDTGIWGDPSTMEDGITCDMTPTFFGTAEANNVVTLVIDGTPAGTAVAIPLDGDDAFQPPNAPYDNVQGNWAIESGIALGNGAHTAVFTFEDPAGNRATTEDESLSFFIDCLGPRITNVTHGDVSTNRIFTLDENTTSVFQPKPDGGPDPLISSIVVHFSDLPLRTVDFDYPALFEALAEEEGHYRMVGDANGNIAILDAQAAFETPTIGADPATAAVKLVFHRPGIDGIWFTDDDEGAPLPDDRFTLTVFDALTDPAGNALDGESGATAPFDGNDVPNNTPPIFPTGDGQHGGDFHARFTVDSRAEIGTWSAGSVYLDTNGNFVFDPDNADYTNRDIVHTLGFATDHIFAGNFGGPGVDGIYGTDDDQDPAHPDFAGSDAEADGFDKLAAYGRTSGGFRWLIDYTSDGLPDPPSPLPEGTEIAGIPVAGNFDPYEENGDEIGLFTGRSWILDTNHNFTLVDDTPLSSQIFGLPFVGDFNGDGYEDLGTLDTNRNTFFVDLGPDYGDVNAQLQLNNGSPFVGPRDRPVAADMDGDGIDDIGLWVPDRSGATPPDTGEWYFLVSGGQPLIGTGARIDPGPDPNAVVTVNFTPVPFGNDIFAQFGDDFAMPIVGNFDPPVTPPAGNQGQDGTETQPVEDPADGSSNDATTERANTGRDDNVVETDEDAADEDRGDAADAVTQPVTESANEGDAPDDATADATADAADGVTDDATSESDPQTAPVSTVTWHNAANPCDANNDGHVTALDALIVTNTMNALGGGPLNGLAHAADADFLVDTNGDDQLTPVDVLLIVNYIEQANTRAAEGEAAAAVSAVSHASAQVRAVAPTPFVPGGESLSASRSEAETGTAESVQSVRRPVPAAASDALLAAEIPVRFRSELNAVIDTLARDHGKVGVA